MATEVVAEVDPFDAAFAKFAAQPEKAEPPAVVSLLDPPPVTEEKKVEDAAAEAAKAATQTTEVKTEIEGLTDEEKAAAAAEAAKAAPVVKPTEAKTNDEDLLKRFAKIVQETQPPVKQPDAPQKVDPPPQPVINLEDAQFLQTFEKEYPDMARALLVVQRAAMSQMLTHVMGEFNKALTARDEILQELGVRQQESDLVTAVPDYRDIHSKVTEWVKTQPKYLQPAYEHVIAEGTAEEVIDLIGQWRASTGTAAPAVQAAASKDTELSTAAKKAAAALAPVTSKRTVTPASASDPNDFDGAFERFAAAAART
jgi:hypothetical protein